MLRLPVIYGVVAGLSLLLLLAYVLFLHHKERWFLVLFVSVFVTNLGYFILSVSGTLESERGSGNDQQWYTFEWI